MSNLFSVVIPVYNCEKYLERAILSVVNQKIFSDIELILVDDGSKDSSGEICNRYSDKYSNITAVHQNNSGVSAARNNGIAHAHGKWIGFLDSDDYLLDDFSDKIIDTQADMIVFNYNSTDCCKVISNRLSDGLNSYDGCKSVFYDKIAHSDFFYSCWNKLYRADIIRKYNLQFPVGVKYAEDMMFVYTYSKYISNLYYIDTPLYFYYYNGNSATNSMKNSFPIYKEIYLWRKEYFESVDCDKEKCVNLVASGFVYRTFFSIAGIAKGDSFLQAVKNMREIVSDKLFIQLYKKEKYGSFKSVYDKLVNLFIKLKMPVMIVVVSKLYKILKK